MAGDIIVLSGEITRRTIRIVGIKLLVTSASDSNDIEVWAGEDKVLTVNAVTAAGTPHAFAAGDVVSFGIKRTADDTDYIIYTETTSDGNSGNTCDITISGASTAPLKGKYIYGIGFTSNGNFCPIIPEAGFTVRRSIVGRGET